MFDIEIVMLKCFFVKKVGMWKKDIIMIPWANFVMAHEDFIMRRIKGLDFHSLNNVLDTLGKLTLEISYS